jgi:hypothetical protein
VSIERVPGCMGEAAAVHCCPGGRPKPVQHLTITLLHDHRDISLILDIPLPLASTPSTSHAVLILLSHLIVSSQPFPFQDIMRCPAALNM